MAANVLHQADARVTVAPVAVVPAPARRLVRDDPAGRLRHRRVLVVGADGASVGPAGTSPATGLAEHLATRAAGVTLLTDVPRQPDGSPDPRYRFGLTFREESACPASPSVTRVRHGVPRRRGEGWRALGELSFAAQGALVPLGEPPDLVVAVTPGPGGALAGARIARRHGVPLLVVVHDLLGGDPGRAAGTLARLERRALGRATRVAVASDFLHAAVRAYGVPADRVAVLPHVTPSGPQVDRLTARRRIGLRPGEFLVAVPDPLSPGQDLNAVLDAGRAAGPRAEVVLLARAGEFRALVHQVGGHPRVRVVDGDGPARALALAAADVLVVGEEPRGALPGTPASGSPGALMECFRAGRPVIAAVDASGPSAWAITLSSGAGLVVRRGDPAVLARAIGELRADDGLRAAMGAAGRAYADHRVDRSAALCAVDALVEGLCLAG
jgi:colanic acid biosynthesis glycosyl transferase WcaI